LISKGIMPADVYAAKRGVDGAVRNINALANLKKVKMEYEKVTANTAMMLEQRL